MRDKTRLFARIVGERCQGHARRVAIAPELFELDELGNAHARLHRLVPKGLEGRVPQLTAALPRGGPCRAATQPCRPARAESRNV